MEAKVYINLNFHQLFVKTIEGETEEEICNKVFELEVTVMYGIRIVGIRLAPEQKIMRWDSTYANYCWGKGRIGFEEFKERCSNFKEAEIA